MTIELLETVKLGRAIVESPWQEKGLRELSARDLATPITRNSWLLKADAQITWLRWWIESLLPAQLPLSELHRKAAVLKAISQALSRDFAILSDAERREYARVLTDIALSIDVLGKTERLPTPLRLKQVLLDSAGDVSRCYLCGSRFSYQAIQRFLGDRKQTLQPAVVVDCIFPRGLRAADSSIVIEHVRPLRAGGAPGSSDEQFQNLRLACNYCNSIKSDSLTLYSRGQYERPINHPQLGQFYPPNRYWVLRTLAVEGKCAACNVTSATAPLYAATRRHSRYINPLNLEVYCEKHDPLREMRWLSGDFFPNNSREAFL